MPECDHCGESFEDEDAYLRHLTDAHEGDLGPIEQRRVEELAAESGFEIPTGPAILAGVILLALVIVAYVIFVFGGSGDRSADNRHEHGTINMTILGERVDFSQPEYQLQADAFHFENGDGEVWHRHAYGVTLAEAMETLDIQVTENSVTFEGTTYRDSDPTYDVTVEVNGQSVDPAETNLVGVTDPSGEGGDHIHIVVSGTNESG